MAQRYSSSFFLRVLRRSRALPLLTLVALIAPMFPRFAWADGNVPAPAGQAGVYPASLGIPETGAAVTNGASLASVDPATGTAHTSIPFQLPNARGRSQPSLGLTYSSSAGVGVGGWGWSMTVPSIQRTPLSGPPTYADPDGGVIDPTVEDRFSFEGQPLVPICTIPYRPCDGSLFLSESNPENFPSVVTTGWSYFRLETGGADGRFFWSPDHNTWLVQYKSGETLELGMALGDVPANAAIDWDHDQPTKAFRWNIVKQYDSERSGTVPANLISYSWAAQTGGALDSQLYLTDVYDTLAPSAVATGASAALTSAAHHVRLYYEYQNKAPAAPTFVPPIWRSTPRYVLSHVDVTAAWPSPPAPGGTTSAPSSAVQRRLVRRYWFGYTADTDASDSNRIELTSVQVEGRCPTATTDLENAGVVSPTSNCPMLPKTQYGYEPAFATLTPTPLSGQLLPQASGYSTYVLDMNSDGIPDIVTMNPATTVGTTYLVSAVEADTLGSVQPLTAVYPTGATPGITPPSTQWTSWTYPHDPDATGDVDNAGYQSPPSFAFPGNWAGNGSINELVPRVSTNGSGAAATGASANYSILSPSTNNNGTVLSGTDTATINFWQPTVSATCCPSGTNDLGYSMYAENVYAIADVDGDGLQDAITDTPVRFVATNPALSWLPYVHFLSLRTSLQAPDGTITPFGRAAPNNVSKVVPPFAEAAPLAAQYNNATVTAVPTLPAAGQYVAEVRTDNYAYPTIRLLGDADWNAAPDQFIDAQDDVFLSTFMEDVNGDGLVDWVTLNTQPPNTTTTTINGTSVTGPGLLYWIGHGDGTFGSCVSGKNDCTGSARFAGAGAPTAMLSVPPILETSNDYPPPTPTPGNTTFLMHDVTGDGFPDLLLMTTTGMTLYINKYGSGFDGGNPVAAGAGGGAVPVWNGTGQVFFGDMNGSGVDDIIVIQGTSVYYVDVESGLRPGLLTSITNGYGATTTLTYATTHDLQLAAVPGGGWTHVSPQILHHVTKVVSTNGFAAGASTPFAETRTVDYAYAEPIYDGRDRQFVGFQTVTTTEEGDATQPSRITQTTFLSGICEVDQSISTACPAASADRPYRLLRGLPVLTDVYDSNLRHLSATHTQYDVHASMGGLDGRDVRFAYPQQVTTFLYDPSAAIPSRTALAQTDATFDEGITSVSNSYRVNSSASSPYVQLVRTQTRDAYGNVTDTNDEGRAGIDSPIHQTTTWSIPSGDPTQWQWRPQTRTRAAAVATAGAPADLPLALSYVFFPDGMVQTVSTTLTGATPLARATSGAAPTPYTAVTNGTELQYQKEYDIYGNPNLSIGPGGTQCSTTEYDATFSLLPTSQLAYRDGCYTAAVVTSQSWDLGLERVTLSVAANQATTQYSYDGFGRLASMIQPNVVTGGPGSGATTTVTYPDASGPSGDDYPVHQTSIVIQDGTNPRQSYQYYDGWGQPLVTVSQADPTAGDALPWVVSGIVQHSARGSVARAYSPTFWTGAAGAFPFAAALPGTSASATYDAFGHMLTETGLDGQVALSATYHALEQDFLDADQLPSAAHAGAMSKILFDGHGRTIAGVRDVHTSSGAIDAITTATVYSTAGSPLQITQSDSVSGTAVVRTMQYDSLGHLVSNVEPNTSSGGVGWRYVYDQSGDLVGTSDARGCGENLTYDGLGRVRWEDYSPCTTDQATYTSAPSWAASTTPTSASGVETFYAYDAPGSATVLNGELYGVYDRAASTSFTYDGRGRMTGTSRQLATPTWTSTGPIAASTNYSSAMFSKTFSYDGLNRPIGESSGADAATLLGTDMIGGGTTAGESLVTGSYSARGILSTVKGSYGTIVASNVVDADGLPLTAVFGDAAGTTVANCYDAKRQLGQLVISRHAALPQCAHAAIGAPSSPAATAQTVLVSDTFVRDAVGNPTSIADGRVAAEWEPGSMPVSRSFQYDDSYRVTQAGYSYATASGGDTFVSPLASVPDDFPMSLAAVTPRVSQQNFAYDWMGNTTSTTDDQGVFLDRSLGPIANGTATAGPNQIVSAGTYLVSGGTKKGAHLAAAYDAAGNTTSLELEQTHSCTPGACPSQFAYEWDEIGQLVHATRWDTGGTTAAADVHYVYDAFGQRVFRSSTDFGGIDFYNIEVFPSLRLENTAWNTTSSTYQDDASTEVAYLTLGGASYGRVFGTVVTPAKVTPPRKPATYAQAVFLEFTDSLGSTSAVVNKATGELVERTTYYAYGGVESDYRAADQSSFWEDYKFTGKENDLEVGLTYFGARYYSPELGRWLSPDPLAIHGASGDLNPYAYVQGRVTRSVDSLGLADEDPPNDPTGSPYSPPSGCDGNTMCLPDDYLTGYPPPQQQQNDPTTLQPSPSGQPTPPDPVDDGLTQAQRAGSPTDPNAPPDPSLTCQGASCSIAEHQESVVNDQFFQNPLGYFQYMTQHHGFMMGGTAPLVEDAAATIVQDVVPTVRNLQALGSVPGFQVHHILPQYLGKMLGYTVEQMVEHPGALISQWAHTGADNPNAVHKAISAALPLMADNARAVYTLEEISEGLKSAYQSIGRSSWFQSIEHLLK